VRRRVVLDTDVASSIVKDRLSPALAGRLPDADWVVSFATVGELWKWAETRRWGHLRRVALQHWLDELIVLDFR
jgi:toxin FitB